MKYQKSELLYLIFFHIESFYLWNPVLFMKIKVISLFSHQNILFHHTIYQKSRLSPQQEIILQSFFNLNKKYNNEL